MIDKQKLDSFIINKHLLTAFKLKVFTFSKNYLLQLYEIFNLIHTSF